MIGMLATAFRKGDYFAGRMALAGRFGTLWPSGIAAKGLAVTFGMPGSGKSTAAAIPAAVQHDGSLLAFDVKGEIARRCYAARGPGGGGVKGRGDRTHVVDPMNLTGLASSSYNPLHEIVRQPIRRALLLLDQLTEGLIKNPGGMNEWCYLEARHLAKGIIAYVLATFPPEKQTLLTVRQLATEGDRAGHARDVANKVAGADKISAFDWLLLRMETMPEGPYRETIAQQAAGLKQMGERQRGTVQSTLKDATEWLTLPHFQDTTGRCDFFLEDFTRERISVFICLPLPDLAGTAAGFMRMFLTMFMETMFRAGTDGPKGGPVLCLVDEFAQFGHVESFVKIGPTMRDYGVKMWMLLQDIGQLKSSYPKDWESFIGCAAMVQFFAMKHGDTLDYLVKLLGERLIRERTPDGRTARTRFPLLDREQAARFLSADLGNVIVWRGDNRPLRLKTAPYYWYLPYWRYTPDPRHPEPWLRRRLRQRAIRRAKEAA